MGTEEGGGGAVRPSPAEAELGDKQFRGAAWGPRPQRLFSRAKEIGICLLDR